MSENKYTDEFFKEYEQRYMRSTPTQKPDPVKTQKPNNKFTKNRILVATVAFVVILAITVGIILITGPNKKDVADGVNNVVSTVEKPKVKPLPEFNENTVELGSKIVSEHARSCFRKYCPAFQPGT